MVGRVCRRIRETKGLVMTNLLQRQKPPSRNALVLAAAAGLALTAFALTVPVQAADSDPVLAKVNGSEIRDSDLKLAEEELGASLPAQMDPATKRDNILNYLIDMQIVAKAADDRKLGDSDDFKRHLAFAR